MPEDHEKEPVIEEQTAENPEVVSVTERSIEPGPLLNAVAPSQSNSRWSKIRRFVLTHKKITIPATVLLLVLVLFAIPLTRYSLAGVVLKKQVEVLVNDVQSGKPVSSAEIRIAGKVAATDGNGIAKIDSIKVGQYTVKVLKKYYADAEVNVTVPITKKPSRIDLRMTPTGRQVKAAVINKVTGGPIKNAAIKVADTEAKTDEKGEVTLVLPADKDNFDAEVSLGGFNTSKVKLYQDSTKPNDAANTFALTPAGKVYFLSKRTGKINVMKADLDGANAEVVLAAAGTEDDTDTILLASQDWKYLALKAKRSTKNPSVYLIDTTQGDKLTNIDEGDATFTLTGWSGHTFVYQVQRNSVKEWQPNRQSLKSFNAETGKLNTIENTSGEGSGVGSYYGTDYKSEYISNVILFGDTLTYTKQWYSGIYEPGNARLAGKQNSIYSIKSDGSNKKNVKGFDATKITNIEAKLYKPKEVYYRVYEDDKPIFYELENGSLSAKGDVTNQFNSFYPTFLASPSNAKTLWSEPRDGKHTLSIGDANGDDAKSILELGEYTAFGWYSDEYALVAKSSSELYIMPITAGAKPLKVTDYHKPAYAFYGYGGGYGGL